jgi:hypothetical protein
MEPQQGWLYSRRSRCIPAQLISGMTPAIAKSPLSDLQIWTRMKIHLLAFEVHEGRW